MSIENSISNVLNKYPLLKKAIKRTYQLGMYTISPKVKFEGNIERISPNDGKEYFFGYYDKSPWDITDRYMLCLRVKNSYKSVAPHEPAEIILFDTHDNNSYKVLGQTRTWNVQQGCMLQWRGPNYSDEIIYNDFREGKYCAVILNIHNQEEKLISMPIYSVSSDGQTALSLDFSRLHRLREGYGYSNLEDITKNEKAPNMPCIWRINLDTDEITSILKYTDLVSFVDRLEMHGAEHKVNHIMINPSGERFMFMHRWSKDSEKFTRLITADLNGENLFIINDDKMTSHCYWKNDKQIVSYAHKNVSGDGYYLFQDMEEKTQKIWPDLRFDGHPSFHRDKDIAVTDTYPNRARVASIFVINKDKVENIARVFAPFRYDNEVRCDLHPRWNRAGDEICFDSVFEGSRQLYTIRYKKEEN